MCYKINIVNILLFFLFANCSLSVEKTSYRLGTALKSGSYFPLGQSIKKILNEYEIEVNVIETNGSVENLELLDKDSLDFAIVQNDIAFFADNGLYPFNGRLADLRGIITFYKEPIYIITTDPLLVSIDQLRHLKINVGPEGGGLFTDTKIILNSVNLWSSIQRHYFAPNIGIRMVLDGQLQASFINNIPDSLLNHINDNKLFMIPLNRSFIENLTQTYPYLSIYNEEVNSIPIATVCVKSILVCKKSMNDDLVYSITKTLLENYDKLDFPDRIVEGSKNKVISGMSLDNWHSGSIQYYNDIDIMPSNIVLRYIWYFLLIPVALIFIIFFSNLFLAFLKKQNIFLLNLNTNLIRFLRKSISVLSDYKYLVIILIVITLFITDLIGIQYFEHKWAIKNNSISDFDNRSFLNNILWLFVFGGSGYSSNLFPQDPFAQFLVTLIPMIGLGGALTIIGFLTSDHIKNHILEIKGLKSKMIRNHIIICGWNKNVPILIQDLLNKEYTHKKPVLVLADIEEDFPLAKYNLDKTIVSYVKGDATKRADLEKANFKEADIVVIVADEKSTDPDARNILKTLTIENYSLELEAKGIRKKDNIYSILELVDVHDTSLAKEAKVDEIISLGGIKTKIMVQSIHNPGVSQFLNEILDFNEFNEIYSLKINKNSKLVGKTFDELLVLLRKFNILLVAINLKSYRDKKEIKVILEQNNLNREVITNPINEAENSYKMHQNDMLIMFAENEKIIDSFVNEIEKK